MKAKCVEDRVGKKSKTIARGSRAKALVLAGRREKTSNDHKKDDLKRNRKGKAVTKKDSAAGGAKYRHIKPFQDAVAAARRRLGIVDFCPIGGKTAREKTLLRTARSFLMQARGPV